MTLRNQGAVVPNTAFSAPLATCVPHISETCKNEVQRTSNFLNHRRLPQQLLPCTTVSYIEMKTRRDMKLCSHFSGNNKKIPRPLPNTHSKAVRPRMSPRAQPVKFQFFPDPAKALWHYSGPAQTQDRGKPVRPKVLPSSSPGHSHSAFITFRMFRCQL